MKKNRKSEVKKGVKKKKNNDDDDDYYDDRIWRIGGLLLNFLQQMKEGNEKGKIK